MSSIKATFLAGLLAVIGLFAPEDTRAQTVITAFGDSLTAGYGLDPEHAFPVLLEQTLKNRGHNVVIHNQGLSGDTTSGGIERLDWAMADNPQIVILALGANDALRGIPVEETRQNLAAMIKQLHAENRKILLAGMLAPPNMGREYGDQFNPIFPQLAKEFDLALYPFFLDGVAGNPDLNQRDGIHPTREGIDIIITGILPYIEALLPAP